MKNKKTKRVYYFTSKSEISLYLILYIIMQIICGYGMFKYYIMTDLKLSEKIITVAICIIHTNYMFITGVIYHIEVKINVTKSEIIIPTVLCLLINVLVGYCLFEFRIEHNDTNVSLMIIALINLNISYISTMVNKFHFYKDEEVNLNEKKK